MTLYRAVYQPTDTQKRLRGLTFAAPCAERAAATAEDWQLPGDRLLTVKALRPLTVQFELEVA